MDLTPEVIFSLIQSGEEFPVDFDDAWPWIGYSTKGNAKAAFENARLVEGIDFQVFMICHKNPKGGRPVERIKLTVDAFKMFCMVAGTPNGRQVRLYFLECERDLKRYLEEQRKRSQENAQRRLVSAMVSDDVVSRRPKFSEEFYELLYKKRGEGWENRDPKKNRPACVGTWTNWTVYDRLLGGTEPGGVKDALNQVNPRVDGRRKDRHHWHLKELGEFHLNSQLEVVKAVARLSPDGNWDRFMRNIEKACPNGEPIQLNLLDMLEDTEPEAN